MTGPDAGASTAARRFGRWPRLAVLGLACLIVAWAAGFVWFIRVTDRPAPLPAQADGIVALTGGAARVETALHLLAEGRGDVLLISGIGGGAELAALARRAGLEPTPYADRVTLGRAAASTRGNAAETREWAQAHGIRTLIVVTAYYHMPRAMAELRRALPDVTLYPFPVLVSAGTGRPRPVSLKMLAEEYMKYLVVATGLSSWLPMRDLSRPAAGITGRPIG